MDNAGMDFVLVLGCHRSGTSVITSSLELFGLNLGSNLLPANEHVNSLGFFENLDVLALNEGILAQLGTNWKDPRPLEKFDQNSKTFSEYITQIRDQMHKLHEVDGILALKEPRIPLLLDLWIPALKSLNINLKIVTAMRNPSDVALSLLKRDSFHPILSQQLWAQSTINSIRAARDFKNTFVFYDDFIENPRISLDILSRTLEVAFCRSPDEINQFLEKNVKSELRHFSGLNNTLEVLEVAHTMFIYIQEHNTASYDSFPEELLMDWQQQLDLSFNKINLHSQQDIKSTIIEYCYKKSRSLRMTVAILQRWAQTGSNRRPTD